MQKTKPCLLLGITSGIAVFKIVDLVKLMKSEGYDVKIIMTEESKKMIRPEIFRQVSGSKVYTSLFPKQFDYQTVLRSRNVEHISLARQADLLIIAPATANIIGKIAAGIADDYLTTIVLATRAPIFICPSMNNYMWSSQVVRENIKKLKERGYNIISPLYGKLACGGYGIGRLPDINNIFFEIKNHLGKVNILKGKKILVTAGGTIEPIDQVRMITNRSTGRMGTALADICYVLGGEVLLLRALSSVNPFYPVKEEFFETSLELKELIKKHIQNYDVIFHAAAVSDFIPEKIFPEKMDSRKIVNLKLIPSEKICNNIKHWNPKIMLVIFKAVYKKNEKKFIKQVNVKMHECSADYVVVNDIGRKGIGFASEYNEVFIVSAEGKTVKINKSTKTLIAEKILRYIFERRREYKS